MADRGDLQDEVERILRRLTLEEIKAVATHLQIAGMDAEDNPRIVLRSVQDQFDNTADADERDQLLRGLPIPDAHTANYERLLNPPQDQVVPVQVNDGGADVGGGPNNVGLDGGQNGGAPNGGGVPNVGQQVGAPLVGLDGGNNALQGPVNNHNAAIIQRNMGQNAMQQNMVGVPNQNRGGLPNIGGYQNLAGFQNFGGIQPLQMRGGVQQQNPWNLGGIQQPHGAQNFGLNQNFQQQNPQFPAMGGAVGNNPARQAIAGPQLQNAQALGLGGVVGAQNQHGGLAQNMNAQIPVQGAEAAAQNVGNLGGNNQAMGGNMQIPGQNIQHPVLVGLPLQNNPQQRVVQMFPREFRMTGSISDDIEKSNEYLDICRQVTDGQRKGYSEVEIMSGLRRIISPGAV